MSQFADKSACPKCGAVRGAADAVCWLCHRIFDDEGRESTGTPLASHAAQHVDPIQKYSRSFSIASMLLVTSLISVCLGVLAIAPGLGVILAILSFPAFIRTAMVVQRRSQLGKHDPKEGKILLFLGSIATTTVVVVVVVVASVGTFCAVCLSAGTEEAIPFAAIAGAAGGICALSVFIRWIRKRWRRDVFER